MKILQYEYVVNKNVLKRDASIFGTPFTECGSFFIYTALCDGKSAPHLIFLFLFFYVLSGLGGQMFIFNVSNPF